MRQELRRAAAVLITLLMTQSVAGVVCQASCLAAQSAASAHPSESALDAPCHGAGSQGAARNRIAPADSSHCRHDRVANAIAAAPPQGSPDRQLAGPLTSSAAGEKFSGPAGIAPPSHAPPGVHAPGAILPLRI